MLTTVLTIVLAFLLVEGLASTVLSVWRGIGLTEPPVAERRHTQYDAELGWVGAPNVDIGDLYGLGVGVRTNSRGFRNALEFDARVPDGRVRALCVGDSFTFGYGVGNDQGWCALLETLSGGRLQTVNMGQGGYGIDQAYLWYRREAPTLDHGLTIFAFVAEDIERTRHDAFLGYGKPLLRVEGDRLVVENVPVPRAAATGGYGRYLAALRQFRSVELVTAAVRRMRAPSRGEGDDGDLLGLSVRVLSEVVAQGGRAGSVPVFVYLPTEEDSRPGWRDRWREHLSREAATRGWIFVDLTPIVRTLTPAEVTELFIPAGAIDFAYAAGHYTVRGNALIARALFESLQRQPAIARLLRPVPSADAPATP